MKNLCVANLNTARELDYGIVGEGARTLVSLHRCAVECGCDDWQNCEHAVQDAWRETTQRTLPEARPRPAGPDQG